MEKARGKKPKSEGGGGLSCHFSRSFSLSQKEPFPLSYYVLPPEI